MNLSDITTYKDGIKQFDFTRTIQFLECKGNEMFGPHFKIYSEDYEILYRLLCWMVRDELHCKKLGIATTKGILLTGPIGCGKTSVMKLLASLSSPERKFVVKIGREITMEFSKRGYDVIHQYSRKSRSPLPICFDDIGVEPPMRYFGDHINVVGEILLSRHELYVNRGMLTHATTNLNASELEARYGNRIRSRLREMFNLIAFPEDARDKRT